MANKQTYFLDEWLSDKRFKPWLQKTDHRTQFRCDICSKTVDLSNMGRAALLSHTTGKKHQTKVDAMKTSFDMAVYAKKAPVSASDNSSNSSSLVEIKGNQPPSSVPKNTGSSSECPLPQSQRGLSSFLLRDDVTRAEIIWALFCVRNHVSFSAGGAAVTIFPAMFKENQVASSMQMQRKKLAYVIVYGLAPFFRNLLLKDARQADFYTVCFDESLNKVAQKEQLDIYLRFWDPARSQVACRYLGSTFLQHSKATDILLAVKEQLNGLLLSHMIQVSMDGPNVNLKFLKDLKIDLKGDFPDGPTLLEIGSCGLHTVHNAFKAGAKATGWAVVDFLRGIYNVFKDVPSRRSDYTFFSRSEEFPRKICAVRWVENASVAETALKILPNLILYVEGVRKHSSEKTKSRGALRLKEPDSPSYRQLVRGVEDKLIRPKITFFKSMAATVLPFLTTFQSERPLAPFLYTDLSNLLNDLQRKFIKEDVRISDRYSAASVDVLDKKNVVFAKDVDLGYETRAALRKCQGVNDKDILLFRADCLKFLQTICKKLQEKSPLTYALTRLITFCDPTLISSSSQTAVSRIKDTLEVLVENGWISGTLAEKAEVEFTSITTERAFLEKCHQFKKSERKEEERLDTFWVSACSLHREDNAALMTVLRLIFTLSHGNASVERGLSVNKESLVENQHHDTLVGLRGVYDAVSAAGRIEEIPITKECILSVRNARDRYMEALRMKEKRNKAEEEMAEQRKRKKQVLGELKSKKQRAMAELDKIEVEIQTVSKS